MTKIYCFGLLFSIIFFKCDGESQEIDKTSSHFSSNIEWERDYSVLNEIERSQCDLTVGICDAFCCGDKDCDKWQKSNFGCGETKKPCGDVLSDFECKCKKPNTPEWFYFLCSVNSNPIYLGKLYTVPKTIDTLVDLKNRLSKNGGNLYKFNNRILHNQDIIKPINHYRFGSPIMSYVLIEDSMKSTFIAPLLRRVGLGTSNHACEMGIEKFRVNKFATCLTLVTQELCHSGKLLSASFYSVQNFTKTFLPFIMKSLDFLDGTQIDFQASCCTMQKKLMRFGQKEIYVFSSESCKECDKGNDLNARWDKGTCNNVLVDLKLQYIVNGSDIVKVMVNYKVGNVGDDREFSDSKKSKHKDDLPLFVHQLFWTNFSDVFANDSTGKTTSDDDSLLNRGYFVGEHLKFGYKSSGSSSVTWEKGFIGVFKNEMEGMMTMMNV